jgi:TPR repeat protein
MFQWYSYMAAQGSKNAMLRLARMYELGIGAPKDLERAAELRRIAKGT